MSEKKLIIKSDIEPNYVDADKIELHDTIWHSNHKDIDYEKQDKDIKLFREELKELMLKRGVKKIDAFLSVNWKQGGGDNVGLSDNDNDTGQNSK